MPFPVIPFVVLGAAAAIAAAMNKGGDTRTNPNELFDDNLPPPARKAAEQALADSVYSGDWRGLFAAAVQMQSMGYPKTAQAYLSVCNLKRQQAGLTPFSYPISAEAMTQAAQESAGPTPANTSRQGADPLPVPSVNLGPLGAVFGIPPTPVTSPPVPAHTPEQMANLPQKPTFAPPTATPPKPATPAPATPALNPFPGGRPVTPGFVPQPPAQMPPGVQVVPVPGGVGVTIPGLGGIVIPGGIMGQPPAAPPAGWAPPGASPPAAPPKPAKSYPTGTHTRPDKTFGYLTQKGDISTQKIADKFGGKGADLMAANPGVDWQKNYPDSDLNIPPAWVDAASPPPAGPRGKNPPKKAGATISPGFTIPGLGPIPFGGDPTAPLGDASFAKVKLVSSS